MAASVETMKPSPEVLEAAVTSVFQPGMLAVDIIRVDRRAQPAPPTTILIAAPNDAGTYPVAIFLHGFSLGNHDYEQVLKHIASFGFIMVAPQFHHIIPTDDIAAAAKVIDWLPEGLPLVLPEGVGPDLSKLALAGHSRGGHAAFSLALGHGKTNLKFSALIGIDPVAGTGKHKYWHLTPKILAYNPSSFDIAMPVLVVGTGLGEEKKNILFPAGAPKDVNHRDFYRRCKPPCYYFVTKDHGHLDMLDDGAVMLQNFFVKKGKNCKDWMRRSVAGIMVAFLKAVLNEKDHDLKVILENPGMAPTVLDPVEHRLG
ncbi:hypothetical protein ACP70R_049130 [Stipagrostis hirtigluma subsp. patula]